MPKYLQKIKNKHRGTSIKYISWINRKIKPILTRKEKLVIKEKWFKKHQKFCQRYYLARARANRLEVKLIEKVREVNVLKKRVLNDKERYILDKRVFNNSPLTLQSIADKHNISRERVRQIQEKTVLKLQEDIENA